MMMLRHGWQALLPAEKVAAVYCTLTSLLMLVMLPHLVDPAGMLVMRAGWLAMTIALVIIAKADARLSTFLSPLRVIAQMAWLGKWYPDTYEFNRCFSNLDHLFAAADQWLFGCQPSLEFSRLLPGAVWSEAFNLGYWSYYPMIAIVALGVLWREWHHTPTAPRATTELPLFNGIAATILTAFFLYYAIYIFLPVAGPQYYFQAVGIDEIMQGHYPALGNYFSSHTDMLPAPGYADGLFYDLVSGAQATGERPTAAFPSSHIGISTLMVMLARRHIPRILPLLLPLWVLLCCATVYIQAHYLVDAIAGLVSAPLALWTATKFTPSAQRF